MKKAPGSRGFQSRRLFGEGSSGSLLERWLFGKSRDVVPGKDGWDTLRADAQQTLGGFRPTPQLSPSPVRLPRVGLCSRMAGLAEGQSSSGAAGDRRCARAAGARKRGPWLLREALRVLLYLEMLGRCPLARAYRRGLGEALCN